MKKKTVLVVGASGFLGSNLVNFLRPRHKVIAAFNEHIIKFPGITHTVYSLTERDIMKRMFQLYKPDALVYCAGINDFFSCAKNPQMSDLVNSVGSVAISSAGDTVPHRLITISSCFVYDGKKGNYVENDITFPETQFGKSKISGENFIRSKSSQFTIFRFAPLIGMGSLYHPSQIDRIRMKLQKGEVVELPTNEIHSFLSIDIALQAIEWAITQESKNATYNLGGLTKVSWFDFGKFLAESLGFDPALIVPGKGQFDQGGDFSLNGTELLSQLKINALLLEESLDLFKKKLVL